MPSGGPPEIKHSVATESCNSCHGEVTAHGDNRIGIETCIQACSSCHGAVDFATGEGHSAGAFF